MKPLVVVGDALLDVDVEGSADRLCPEAPAPVVDVSRRCPRPGGAGLAGLLAARSAPEVIVVTALGHDDAGRRLGELIGREATVVPLPLDGTTVTKTRVRAGGQTLVRLDSGDGRAASTALRARSAAALHGAGAILVADYGRGVAAHPEIRRLLTELAQRIPVVWDPHPRGSAPIPGARLITPNEAEAHGFAPGHGDPVELARALRARWEAEAVSVTLGSHGAALSTGQVVPVSSSARMAGSLTSDVCGAGDRFATAATAALMAGASEADAVAAAVQAASRFVLAGGASALSTPDSLDDPGPRHGPEEVWQVVERTRRAGGRLVATGGCFDLLHPGHVTLLRQARALGDALVVCLNSDESVRGLKGAGRPILAAADRARMLCELSSVDAVAIFDEPSPGPLLDRLRPDVWVKGGDYTGKEMPEAATVRRHGGEVVLLPVVDGHSTSRLVQAAQASV
ncbi:PfkB family carbohydrate kinase [Amycolatopsis pigmentata]|uniref:PfkB family carbohydrate kinase n=1 Tax=Amycolatopsis pigmentata TaxID=450801 RepID=A0ABW5FXN3_9PSEU